MILECKQAIVFVIDSAKITCLFAIIEASLTDRQIIVNFNVIIWILKIIVSSTVQEDAIVFSLKDIFLCLSWLLLESWRVFDKRSHEFVNSEFYLFDCPFFSEEMES